MIYQTSQTSHHFRTVTNSIQLQLVYVYYIYVDPHCHRLFCSPNQKCIIRGVYGRGQGGHVPLRNCHAEIFCLNSMKFVTFNQIFSIFSCFFFWGGGFAPDPPGLCASMDPAGDCDLTHSFVPFRNKFLATLGLCIAL